MIADTMTTPPIAATNEPDKPPLLSVNNLVKHFTIKGGLLQREIDKVHAVDGVSFDVASGETLSLEQTNH